VERRRSARILTSPTSPARVAWVVAAMESAVYGTYHISSQDPSVLYNREDVWDLAVDQPYYVEIRLPDEGQAEYLQIVPYSPFNKQNLVSWLAVRNDPGHYGEMTAFVLPKDKVVLGPKQVMSCIQQTPAFSSSRTLLNQQGSSLIEGTLLVVPIGDSFLYFEPITSSRRPRRRPFPS